MSVGIQPFHINTRIHHRYPQTFYKEERCHHQKRGEFISKHGKPAKCLKRLIVGSIDNNPVENTIRPAAIGRKNWLFTGFECAGKRASAIQTLIGTAKLNGLNPAERLAGTLEKLPAWPNSRIDEWLPLAPEAIEALLKEYE